MQQETKGNTLLDTLYDIYESEMADDFAKSYYEAQEILKDKFLEKMIELSVLIRQMQNECKPGTSILSCAILLTMPFPDEPELNDKDTDICIKAAAVWMELSKK